MTRPRKATVDFFPHYCSHGKTMFVLEETYGKDGYYFWFKLLEMLGSTDNHFIDVSNPATWRFLIAKTKSDATKAQEILDCLADMDAIDADLWKDKIIWSQNFVDGVAAAYRNRLEDIPKRPDILRQKPLETPQSDANQAKLSATNERTNELYEPNELRDLSTAEPIDRFNGFKISNLAELWNDKAPPELARVSIPFKRTPKNLKPLTAMISLYPDKTWWESVISKIHQSSFLRGRNNRGWKATFDFVVSKADEINDGKYIDIGGATQTERNVNTAIGWLKKREEIRNEPTG